MLYPSTLRDLLIRIAQARLVQAKWTDRILDEVFENDFLEPWDIEPKSADEFVSDQVDLNGKVVWSCVQQIADTWRNPPGTTDGVLNALERNGLLRSVAELRGR